MNIANMTGEELLSLAGVYHDRQYRRLQVGRSWLWVWMIQELSPWVYVARAISPHPSRREGQLDWLVKNFWRSYQGIGEDDLRTLGYQVVTYPGGWMVTKNGLLVKQEKSSLRTGNKVVQMALNEQAWAAAREHYERSI